MPTPRFDKFYRYAELTRLLKAYAKEYPQFVRLASLGRMLKSPPFGWMAIFTPPR